MARRIVSPLVPHLEITTIEGLAGDGGLHPVQEAWLEEDVGRRCVRSRSGLLRASQGRGAVMQAAEDRFRSRLADWLLRTKKLSTKIVEQDILRLHSQAVQHLHASLEHERRTTEVVLDVLGCRMILQIVVINDLVDEPRVPCPVVLG